MSSLYLERDGKYGCEELPTDVCSQERTFIPCCPFHGLGVRDDVTWWSSLLVVGSVGGGVRGFEEGAV